MNYDVIVVGCGIIGATVSKALEAQGRNVLVLDDRRAMSGTAPSGGHLKPSWFGGMSKKEYEPAMELLSSIWGMSEEQFIVRPTPVRTSVFRVDTDKVLEAKYQSTNANVTAIYNIQSDPVVHYCEQGCEVQEAGCNLLIVSAGSWCNQLVPEIAIERKQGVSFRLKGRLLLPFIKPWAPYKQVVAHQQSIDEIWIGDGSAILEKNWTEERTQQCLDRCMKAVGTGKTLIKAVHGIRPYCQSGKDPCLLQKVGSSTWVATGAGKSGTIAAGWVARRILDATS